MACITVVAPLLAGLGAIEVALVFALRAANDRNLGWPLSLIHI